MREAREYRILYSSTTFGHKLSELSILKDTYFGNLEECRDTQQTHLIISLFFYIYILLFEIELNVSWSQNRPTILLGTKFIITLNPMIYVFVFRKTRVALTFQLGRKPTLICSDLSSTPSLPKIIFKIKQLLLSSHEQISKNGKKIPFLNFLSFIRKVIWGYL